MPWTTTLELLDSVGWAVHLTPWVLFPGTSPEILLCLASTAEMIIVRANQFLRRVGGTVGAPVRLIELAAQADCVIFAMAKSRALFAVLLLLD